VAWYARNGTNGRSTNDRGFTFADWTTLRELLVEK
jgi:putative hydrolase of the HAD superfamily